MEKLDFKFKYHGWAEQYVIAQGKSVSLHEEIFITKGFILNKLKEICIVVDKINEKLFTKYTHSMGVMIIQLEVFSFKTMQFALNADGFRQWNKILMRG